MSPTADALEVRTLTSRVLENSGTDRIIEIMIAPYGETAQPFAEEYGRGVFGSSPGPIPLKLETGRSHGGPVVGRSIEIRDTPAGYVGTFRISETPDGDDALTLAADGALGASAGFIVDELDTSQADRVVIRSATLHEVTLTGVPAYAGGRVLDVRSTGGQPMSDENTTAVEADPTPDAPKGEYVTRDDVSDLVTRAIDEFRGQQADDAAPEAPDPNLEARHRGHVYRSMGDLVGDVIAHARRSDPTASERLTSHIDEGIVAANGSAIQVRAFSSPAVSVGQGVARDGYIPDLLELLREGRPVANLFNGRGLPPGSGNNLELPRVTQGAAVGYQATQGSQVTNQNVDTDRPTFPKSTMAGGQGVSVQAEEWTNPAYMDEVIRDHLAAYAEFLDSETINGDGATPNATAYTGILAGATAVPAGGAGITDVLGKIGSAWAAVYQGSRRAPVAVMMNSKSWGLFLDETDSDGRPIVSTDQPRNPAGIGDAASVSGMLRGLPVVVDENIPDDQGVGTNESPIILGSFRDALLFENQGAPAQVALTYPDVLVTDVTVYGFSSLAIRRPAAFATITGLVTG